MLAVAEVRRVWPSGAKSLQLPVFPTELGLPDYFDERYDPLFAAIQETGLPICCHIGLKTTLDDLQARDPTPNKGSWSRSPPLMTAEAFGMWIMGGVFERFPGSRSCSSSRVCLGGLVADIVDDMAKRQGYGFPAITELPSVYFHRNVYLTFIDEGLALHRLRDLLGVENLLWSTRLPASGHQLAELPQGGRGAVRGHPGRRAGADGVRQRRAGLEPLIC